MCDTLRHQSSGHELRQSLRSFACDLFAVAIHQGDEKGNAKRPRARDGDFRQECVRLHVNDMSVCAPITGAF